MTNAGTIRKTGAEMLALQGAGVPYSNTGTIDLQGGIIQILDNSTLTSSGAVALAGGTTFFLNQVTLAAGTTFSGTGLLNMNGTTTVSADITIARAGLALRHAHRRRTDAHGGGDDVGGGTLSTRRRVDIQAGQTLTFPNTGGGRLLTTGTSLRNAGTVSWTAGSGSLVYQGGTIAVTNQSGAQWTYGAGSYNITNNGDPESPLGSFYASSTTVRCRAPGNPATTLTFGNRVTPQAASGTTSNIEHRAGALTPYCAAMRIRLSDDRRAALLRAIKQHFATEFDDPISDFRASELPRLLRARARPARLQPGCPRRVRLRPGEAGRHRRRDLRTRAAAL